MFTDCPKGCYRRSRRVGHMLTFEATSAYGRLSQRMANRVATPLSMARAYAEMVAKTSNLGRAPTLEFYDNLHGVGGLFIPGDWVIAIGKKDIEDIADHLLATERSEVVRIAQELSRNRLTRMSEVRELVINAGMMRCIAHELGHALIHRGAPNPFSPDGEAGADYYAGRFDALRGLDWRLGEMFFHAIGCVGPTCSHPSPEERANAYMDGYEGQPPARAWR